MAMSIVPIHIHMLLTILPMMIIALLELFPHTPKLVALPTLSLNQINVSLMRYMTQLLGFVSLKQTDVRFCPKGSQLLVFIGMRVNLVAITWENQFALTTVLLLLPNL